MADEDLNSKLAKAEKALETANANWTADARKFGLELVYIAEVNVKKIKYEIEEAKVEALVAQGKRKDDAQVKVADALRNLAREEHDKTEAMLDNFIKSKAAAQGTLPTAPCLSLS